MSQVMRRRTILLAAGLPAYLNGASVRAYLSCTDELCNDCDDVGWRVVTIIQHPRAAFNHPILTAQYLVASVRND
jgi:hypothetical protein